MEQSFLLFLTLYLCLLLGLLVYFYFFIICFGFFSLLLACFFSLSVLCSTEIFSFLRPIQLEIQRQCSLCSTTCSMNERNCRVFPLPFNGCHDLYICHAARFKSLFAQLSCTFARFFFCNIAWACVDVSVCTRVCAHTHFLQYAWSSSYSSGFLSFPNIE